MRAAPVPSVVPLALAALGLLGAACALGGCQSDGWQRPEVADPFDQTDVAPGEDLSAGARTTLARGTPSGPTPIADGTLVFSSRITHPYLPLSSVRYSELRSDSERIVRAVADQTGNVHGYDCLVLVEEEYDGGELGETMRRYLAQDNQGTVWCFGESVDEYDSGQVVSHGGSWLVGRDVAEPALYLPATPTVGLAFKPENAPPNAEVFAQVDALDAESTVPMGHFAGVLVVKEGLQPGQWTQRKYYAKGLGLISVNSSLNLVAARTSDGGVP